MRSELRSLESARMRGLHDTLRRSLHLPDERRNKPCDGACPVEVPSREAIVNSLAQELGLPVVLEDASQQLIAYSPHYDMTDRIRRDTIMSQTTTKDVVDYFRPFELQRREDPFVVPGSPADDILPRLCIPIRHHDVSLGFAWVLLPEEQVSETQLKAAVSAREALTQTMVAESRGRAAETETVLNLLSADPDLRILGLSDVEARGTFGHGRPCSVVVCLGHGWEDPAVRMSFWGTSWAPTPRDQLRAVTPREGIAVVAISSFTAANRDIFASALRRVQQAGRKSADNDLVVGVGSLINGPAQAHRAYREARLAARVARGADGPGVALWQDLGVNRFLTQMPQEVLADAVDPRLRQLVTEAPELAVTVECYLEHAGAIAPVAEALHIHRTTLYYRLERVTKFGIDLGRGEDRLSVHAGLRALRLMSEWPVAH